MSNEITTNNHSRISQDSEDKDLSCTIDLGSTFDLKKMPLNQHSHKNSIRPVSEIQKEEDSFSRANLSPIKIDNTVADNNKTAVISPVPNSEVAPKYIVDDLDKPWNLHIMLQLKSIGERSNGYKWMHNEELEYYNSLSRRVMILEIVLATLHGASIASSFVAIFSGKESETAIIVITCVQTILYICLMITKTYREGMVFEEKIYNHRWTSMKFGQLASQIQNQFCLPVSKRSDDQSFLEYRSNDFNDIQFGAPVIRPVTKHKYLESIKDTDISKTIALGNINHIEIVMERDKSINQNGKPASNGENSYKYQLERFLRYN